MKLNYFQTDARNHFYHIRNNYFGTDFLRDTSDATNSVSWKKEIALYMDACGKQNDNT